MKIKLVCDCCDNIFKEIDIPADAGMTDLEALTGEEIKDIIVQDNAGTEIYVSATCDRCISDLELNGHHDLIFYSEPRIH